MLETFIGDENINLTNASRRSCSNPPMCVNVMCRRCTAMFNRFAWMCVSRNKAGILYKFVFFPLLGVVRSCDGFSQLILVRVSCSLSAEHVKGGFYFLDFSPRVPFGLGEYPFLLCV